MEPRHGCCEEIATRIVAGMDHGCDHVCEPITAHDFSCYVITEVGTQIGERNSTSSQLGGSPGS